MMQRCVLRLGHEFQVLNVGAGFVPADMVNLHPFGDAAMMLLPHKAVAVDSFPVDGDSWVSAHRWRCSFAFGHDAKCDWYTGSGAFA